MEITEFDKKVYNMFLSTTRRAQDKPYTRRENFDNLKDKDLYLLKILSSRFDSTPHLFCEDFFKAPFEIIKDGYFGLKFYTTLKAIGAFAKYSKLKESRQPDLQVEYIKQSFGFIYDYCKTNNIRLQDYAYQKTGAMEDFLKHIKNHKVSVFVAFAIPAMYTILINMESDIFHLYFGDMDLILLQRNFERSKVAKAFCKLCVEKISTRLVNLLDKVKQN